jgi:hypothetical protein
LADVAQHHQDDWRNKKVTLKQQTKMNPVIKLIALLIAGLIAATLVMVAGVILLGGALDRHTAAHATVQLVSYDQRGAGQARAGKH